MKYVIMLTAMLAAVSCSNPDESIPARDAMVSASKSPPSEASPPVGWREVCSKTEDNCGGMLAFPEAKGGSVTVNKGETKFIEFNDYRDEVRWTCDGTGERSACGSDFLAIEVTRKPDGREFVLRFFAKG